jgi:hypothetical protein
MKNVKIVIFENKTAILFLKLDREFKLKFTPENKESKILCGEIHNKCISSFDIDTGEE